MEESVWIPWQFRAARTTYSTNMVRRARAGNALAAQEEWFCGEEGERMAHYETGTRTSTECEQRDALAHS